MTFYSGYLETVTCYSCAVVFGMPSELKRSRLSDRKSFWCPNGHAQHFTGKSDAQVLAETTKRLQREQQVRIDAERRLEEQAEARREAGRRAAATRRQRHEARVMAGAV